MRLRPAPLAPVALLALWACHHPGPTVVVTTARGPVEIAVEVADTDATRAHGLMYRTELADGRGMLFVFATNEVHDFWMKNTLIALDMIWIGEDRRVIGIRASTTPLSMATIGIGVPTRLVLEVSGGFAARRGIAVGDPVELRSISPATAGEPGTRRSWSGPGAPAPPAPPPRSARPASP